jgi:hypothetical protein
MSEIIADVLRAFKDYPIIQGVLSVVSIFVMAFVLIRKGERDRKSMNGNGGYREPIPQFLLISPLNDVFGAIHDMAEQGRQTNQYLERLVDLEDDQLREMFLHRQLLEFIRNNQEMRGDPQPPPNPHKQKRGI